MDCENTKGVFTIKAYTLIVIFIPTDSDMMTQTITVEITNESALRVLQDLQKKRFINIIIKPGFDSFVFSGKPLTAKEFKEWIEKRESGPSMTLKEAKAKWEKKEKKLLKIAK